MREKNTIQQRKEKWKQSVIVKHYSFACNMFSLPWITQIHTYLLTPWSRVLLEKLTSLQLGKKFPAFYVTRRFITAFTSARHLSLSCASPLFPLLMSYQSISPGPRLHLLMFRNLIRFYGGELLAPRRTTKLEDHPLSAVRDSLFNTFAVTLYIGDRSSNYNLRKRHAVSVPN